MKILVDMDGVLVDFYSAACKTHKRYDHPKGSSYLHKIWGITKEQFWEPLDNRSWWANLKPTVEFDEIIDQVSSYTYCVCSSPSGRPEVAAGKVEWLKKYLPDTPWILTREKYILADDDTLLIDDSDYQVKSFVKAGGKALLIPRAWNSLWQSNLTVSEVFNEYL